MESMRPWSRETRLLVVTIVLAVSVLLALARLRFPGGEPTERLSLPARPLQQLADRAAFDDFGAAVARVSAQVRPVLRVMTLAGDEAPASATLSDVLLAAPRPVAHAVAIHVGGGRYVALPGRATAIGAPDGLRLARRDHLRQVAVFAGPSNVPVLSSSRPALPAFLVVAEATVTGVAVRPMFGPSAETVRDPRWDQPVNALGPSAAPAGALVFSLEGAFVGGIADGPEGRVLVPADALLDAADGNGHAREPRAIGIHVQPLDPALRAALGADTGAVVSAVDAHGPAAGRLEPGDVVRSIGGVAVRGPDDLLLRAALAPPDSPIDLEVVRRRAAVRVRIESLALGTSARAEAVAAAPAEGAAAIPLGATLAASPRGTRITRVAPGGAAARAGLRSGDEVRWILGAAGANPATLLAAWKALPPGGHLALGIDRGAPIVLAVARP
jgi:hypothetical protein